jgi:hypothetical protein
MRRPSPTAVIAIAALFVALGGPAHAARLIDGKDLKPGSVASKQVKDHSIAPRDLSKRAVRALTATADGSIGAAKLADSAVTTRAIAPGSVLTGSVGDNSLTAADLAASSVGTDEVADNAVGQTEIRNNGVGASEIADQSIDGGEIIDGGLLARDVGRFAGNLIVDFSELSGGECQAAAATGTPPDIENADISNDLVVLAAGASWPIRLTYGVANGSEPDQFLVYACNPTNSLVPIDPPAVNFRYVILGFG